jgi:hypothetical protein
MPSITEECTTLTAWFLAGWPFLFILSFFFFSGGYVMCALARAAGDNWRGDDNDPT